MPRQDLALIVVIGVVMTLWPALITAQSLPSGWRLANVGGPGAAGSAGFVEGVFTVSGAGSGVGGRADQFAFVYRQMTGDGAIVARVAGFQGWRPHARAGIMLRESLSAGSRNALLSLLGSNLYLELTRRTTTGGQTTSIAEAVVRAPVWLKLERRGPTVLALRSADGSTWSRVGETFVTSAETVYVGLMIANRSSRVNTTFSDVDGFVSTQNQPPAVSLSAPTSGITFTAPATVAVSANATDPDDAIARVTFYAGTTLLGSDTSPPYAYTWTGAAPGTYSLTAVADDQSGARTTSAARTIVISSAQSNQPPSVFLVAPASGATFTAPANVTVSANAADVDGTVARVDFYAGSTLIGSDMSSPYSYSWSGVPVGTYSISAVARDNAGVRTASGSRAISVMGNQPPSISLTAPLSGTTFTAPATIGLTASASDPDGTIARVDFYSGTALLGSDSASPYSLAWSSVPAGQHSITAVARDNAGAMTVSSARTVGVNNPSLPGNALFVPSANHDTAVDRYVIEIFPSGADPAIANPVASRDVGKPAIVNGECQADISQTVSALSSGTYIATVSAIGPSGVSRSGASSPFIR